MAAKLAGGLDFSDLRCIACKTGLASSKETTTPDVSGAERKIFSKSRIPSGSKARKGFLVVEELARSQIPSDRRHTVECGRWKFDKHMGR